MQTAASNAVPAERIGIITGIQANRILLVKRRKI